MKLKKALCLTMAAMMTCSVPVFAADTEAAADTAEMVVPEVPEIEGSDVEATVSICAYYGGDSTDLANFAIEQINEKFPNVTLEIEPYPEDGGQTVKTRAATGDLPDILLVDDGTINVLAESGSILELEQYIDQFNLSAYYKESTLDNYLYSRDGKMYQFPIGNASPVLWYYNKQIFEDCGVKVPENYDELLEAVKTFREQDVIPLALFGKEPWPLGAFYDSFALKTSENGLLGLSEGEGKASDENNQKAIKKMEELIQAGIFQDGVASADFDTASEMFKSGQSAMFMNGSWYISEALEALGDQVDIMPYYPTGDAGDDTNQNHLLSSGGISGLAVTASAEDPELAAQIAFLFGYYREVNQYETKSLITTPLKTDNLVLLNELDHMSQALSEVVGDYVYGSSFIHIFPNTKFSTTMSEELQKFLVGESAEDFTENVDGYIEKMVE